MGTRGTIRDPVEPFQGGWQADNKGNPWIVSGNLFEKPFRKMGKQLCDVWAFVWLFLCTRCLNNRFECSRELF